ncbi:MAG: PucR family transcriptional regulator ligand-binding domain-containing protein [Mogibacterium sp.]|nr:PucR family transcriptional regulator ligand-binding domain-containing protein [Mogibacterium sp.]
MQTSHEIQPIEQSYYPTIRELLESPILQSSKLLAGASGLNHVVYATTQSDSPDFLNYLTNDEIMVTNLYPICNDEEALRGCIPAMAKIGVSGLFLKPNWLPEAKVPDYMIRQADEYGLPLIELDWDVDFFRVGNVLSDELTRRRTLLLNNTLSINRILNQIITEEAGLERIAEMISNLCRGSVLIMDTINNRQQIHLTDPNKEDFRGKADQEIISSFAESGEVHEILVGHNSYGYLYLYQPMQSPALSPELLDQVLSVIPIEISREQSTRAATNRMFGNFLMHLLSEPILDEQQEYIRAKEFQLPLDAWHYIIRLHLEYQDDRTMTSLKALHQSLLSNRFQALYRNTSCIVHTMETQTGFLFLITDPVQSTDTESTLSLFHRQLRSFEAGYPELRIFCGVGRPYFGIKGMIQSDSESRVSLKAARSGGNRYIRYDRLGMIRLLYSGNVSDEITAYVREVIGQLLDFDLKNTADLLRTLDYFIRFSGNIKRISEEMYTHYNTVSYRVRNIQKITGRDLRNAEDLYELQTALRLYHFMANQ